MASNSNSNSNHGFVSQLRFSLTIDSASRVDPISHSRLLVRRWSRTPLSKDALSPIIKHITRSREKRKQEEEQGLAIEEERRLKETKRRKVEEDSLNLDQTKRELERIRFELRDLEEQKHKIVNRLKEYNNEETKIREIRRTLFEQQRRTHATQNLVPGIGSGIAVPRGPQPIQPQQVFTYGSRPPMPMPPGLPQTSLVPAPQLRASLPPGPMSIGPPPPGLPPQSSYGPVMNSIKREPIAPPPVAGASRSPSSAADVKPGLSIKSQFEAGLSPLSDSLAPPHARSHHMSPEGPAHRLPEHSPPQLHHSGPPYAMPGAGIPQPQGPLRSPLQPPPALGPQSRGPDRSAAESLQGFTQMAPHQSRHVTASPVEVNPHVNSPRNSASASRFSPSKTNWPIGPSRMRSPPEAQLKSEPERFGSTVVYPPSDRTPPQLGLPMGASPRGPQPQAYGMASAASSSRGGRPPSPSGMRRPGERDEQPHIYREYGQPSVRREEHHSSSSAGAYPQQRPQEYREPSVPRTHGSSPGRNVPGGPPDRFGGPPQGGMHHQQVQRSSVTSSPHHSSSRPPDSSRDRDTDRFRPAEQGRREHYEQPREFERERERSREPHVHREGDSRERYSRERERERLYAQQDPYRERDHERHGSGGQDIRRGSRDVERQRDPRENAALNPSVPSSVVPTAARPLAVSPFVTAAGLVTQPSQIAPLSSLSVPPMFPLGLSLMPPLVNMNPLIMGIPLVAAAAAAASAGHNMPNMSNIQQMLAQMQQAPPPGVPTHDPAQMAAFFEQYQQQLAGLANLSAAANHQNSRRNEYK